MVLRGHPALFFLTVYQLSVGHSSSPEVEVKIGGWWGGTTATHLPVPLSLRANLTVTGLISSPSLSVVSPSIPASPATLLLLPAVALSKCCRLGRSCITACRGHRWSSPLGECTYACAVCGEQWRSVAAYHPSVLQPHICGWKEAGGWMLGYVCPLNHCVLHVCMWGSHSEFLGSK